MSGLVTVIPTVRESVTAILRLHVVKPETVKKGKARPASIGAALAGSAFCVVADRYLVTAFHILNDGKPRDPKDKFYAFVVPLIMRFTSRLCLFRSNARIWISRSSKWGPVRRQECISQPYRCPSMRRRTALAWAR